MPAGCDPRKSIVGLCQSKDKANTRNERAQRRQLMKCRLVPLPGRKLFKQIAAPAELQPGNCNEIREDQRICARP